jgi:S-(hydroxymethyl)glutathione dehydrogenase / alcohol dehydrogenase
MQVKKARAAILVESLKPLELAEIELPDSLEYGQVLVRVHYSGICASQIHEIDATKGPDKYLPHLLGHEGAATVLEIAPGVKTVQPGERVVMHWRKGSGVEAEPASYLWNGHKVNSGWVTTFNDYAVVSENRLTVIPTDFNMKLAPLLGCAVTTGLGVVNNDAQVKIGQSVVVFGVGGVGLSVVQAAHMVSAYPVVAVDLIDLKLEYARQFGASHVVNSGTVEDLDAEIRAIVGGEGADVVIDTTGVVSVIERGYELTHSDGKTILVGVPKKGDNVSIYTLPLHFNKVLTGSHGGDSEPQVDIPNYIRLSQAGRLKLEEMISHELTLDEVNEAIALVRSGEAARVLLTM